MKTTIFQFVFCILVIATAVLSSCIKEELPVTGTVSGTLSAYDPTTPLVKTPVEGIKVYLINADYKFNTTTYAGNSAALIDSTLSDARGNYCFTNIPLGRYNVCPITYSNGYRFETIPTGKIDPLQITESSPDHIINFASPLPNSENTPQNQFKIRLWIKENNPVIASYFTRERRNIFLCPIFDGYPFLWRMTKYDLIQNYLQDKIFEDDYGTILGNNWSNNFLFHFYNSNGVWVGTYEIWQDLGNTPPSAAWIIDLKAKTIGKTGL